MEKRLAVSALAIAVLVTPGWGCTLLLDLDANECEVPTDCTDRGPEFANTTCSPEGICIPLAATGCTTNKACTDAFDGAPYICKNVGDECTPLLSETCPQIYGDHTDDNAVILGMGYTLTGPEHKYGERAFLALTLAFEEIRKNANGLPPSTPGGARRPIVMVACDDGAALDNADEIQDKSVKHLIDDVGVPAIFGYSYSDITIRLATSFDIPANVMVLCSHCTSPSLVTLPDNGLLWTAEANDADVATPLAALLQYFEPIVREEQGIAEDDPIRVGLVSSDSPAYSPVADVYDATVQFNGMSAVDNGSNYRRADYKNPIDNPEPDYSAVADAMLQHKPHIIQFIGNAEVAAEVMPLIENGLGATDPKPHYIFIPDNYPGVNVIDAINATDMGTGNLYPRIHGVYKPPADLPLYDQFKIRYEAAYPGEKMTIQGNHYDSAYTMAYAIAAAGNVPKLDGPTLAAAMSRLVPEGVPIDVGPAKINDAFSALAAGGNIDLQGIAGSLDWNLQTGIPPGTAGAWCIAPDGAGALDFSTNTGLEYKGSSREFTGEYNCQ